MKCRHCGQEIAPTVSGRWVTDEFSFDCETRDDYATIGIFVHQPAIDDNAALEAWLDT